MLGDWKLSLRRHRREREMGAISFRQLPLVAKIAVGVAFYNAWASFEEFVVDRVGLWRYMPYYRVGKGCAWDVAVGLLILVALVRLSWQRDETTGDGRAV
jgi:hypothetical protein